MIDIVLYGLREQYWNTVMQNSFSYPYSFTEKVQGKMWLDVEQYLTEPEKLTLNKTAYKYFFSFGM